MSEHTKEPWHLSQDGQHVLSRTGEMSFAHVAEVFHDVEDARRIVACVNALAGVSTEHLEQYGLPDFAQKISDLAQQRDKLLAAPSVPDGLQTIPSHDQLTKILNGLDRCVSAESRREFLRVWIRDWTVYKLAAAPTPPKLSGERILELFHANNFSGVPSALRFARAIERELLGVEQE